MRAVPPSRRNCASAWTHRYVLPYLFFCIVRESPTNNPSHDTEIAREEEEHRQLPPDENVSQGRGPTEEGRRSGLNFVSRVDWRSAATIETIEIFIREFWDHISCMHQYQYQCPHLGLAYTGLGMAMLLR